MDRATNARGEEGEANVSAITNQGSRRKPFRHESHSQNAPPLDEMSIIPESEEMVFANPAKVPNTETTLLPPPEPEQPSGPSSLLRRLTTRLKRATSQNQVEQLASIPLAPLRSLRRNRDPAYENLHDVDEDYGNVPVDLSVLSGLGFEVTEAEGQPSSSDQWLEQETAYQSPQSQEHIPSFQSFIRKRQLGDGLVVGAKVRRDPSVRQSVLPTTRAEEIQRNRTVRKTVKHYAREHNVIVAVSESVDLSFLEGHVMRQKTNQTFDTLVNRAGTYEDQPQSYFFPKDPVVPNWRPVTMSTPYIIFLAIIAFGLAGCQELLYQRSRQREKEQGGLLAFNDVAIDLSVGLFFVWKYLPTMITIIYAVLFSVMDFDIRRLEPFYQLSQPEGSPASESLNVDHLTTFQYFVPFNAFRLRQWTVFFSTLGNIIASTVSPALQNPSVDFKTNPACTGSDDDPQCPTDVKKFIVVMTPVWSRLLSGSYLVVGIVATILFFQLRRKSGLLSDPKGIAGIASMATKSHILRDFRGTHLATRKEIQNELAHRRFVLYKSSIWQGEWNFESKPERESARNLTSPHPPMLRLAAGFPFIAAQMFCLAAVPIISLTSANVIPNKVPWLPILIATMLKLVWSTFEADVRLMEPFYQLSRGNAAPENSLTLDYQSTIYGYLPFKAAVNGHWLLSLCGICSVALDVLSVTVSSFSIQADMFYSPLGGRPPPERKPPSDSSGDETKLSFFTSLVVSMTILTFVIITTILVYLLRRHPFLPREPSTIASVLAFIYASRMLDDFIDTEQLTNNEMEKKLKKVGKRYALGWFRGRDGTLQVAIDQEPCQHPYEHGKRYDQAVFGFGEGHYHGEYA